MPKNVPNPLLGGSETNCSKDFKQLFYIIVARKLLNLICTVCITATGIFFGDENDFIEQLKCLLG